jgi:beta-xylosidase
MSFSSARRRAPYAGVPALLLAALLAAFLAAFLGAGDAGRADASVGSDAFRPTEPYAGDFSDPTVIRVGSTYYAYATTTANMNLPVMVSNDLVSWWPRPEALWSPARWAHVKSVIKGKSIARTWAPSVAKVGSGYTHAYATELASTPGKMCVSLSRSLTPDSGFVDSSTRPVVCPSDEAAIDPQVYVGPHGAPFLVWKTEGIPRVRPTRLMIRRLATSGTALQPGTTTRTLLRTALPWEGNVIENPAMVHYGDRFYLFYSGNRFATASYATGYAICRTAIGPCTRPSTRPLLATDGVVAGPGGATPFVDTAGRLRLAYAAWDYGHVGYPSSTGCRYTSYGCNQRRLHIATLAVLRTGALAVTDRG